MDRHQELHEENESLRRRLDVMLGVFVGQKWRDCGLPEEWKPDYEKYVTRDSLLQAIDWELRLR